MDSLSAFHPFPLFHFADHLAVSKKRSFKGVILVPQKIEWKCNDGCRSDVFPVQGQVHVGIVVMIQTVVVFSVQHVERFNP